MRVSSISIGRTPAADRLTSAAVVHAGVLHPQDFGFLVLEEAAVDDLPEEERVVADRDPLTHFTVEVRDGLREHRRTRDLLDEREVVQRLRDEIDVDRLRELAHDRAILSVDEVEA